MAFIEFHDVTKIYGEGAAEVRAADGINFEIEQGEFVLIVGPSGAGKTTILNMLGGMEKPTSGQIIFNGRDISQLDEKGLTTYRRNDVGFVFQFYNLIASLTARENVELASEICDNPLSVEVVLENVGLTERMNNFPAELSGGEQQRVAIARALAKNPQLVLADEPTGALDFKTGRAVLELLQDACHDSNKTLVLITHNLSFEPIADRIIHIDSGTVDSISLNDDPVSASTITW